MTAEERYAKCKTIEELNDAFHMDEMSANTFEFLGACERAYKKRYRELYKPKDGEQE